MVYFQQCFCTENGDMTIFPTLTITHAFVVTRMDRDQSTRRHFRDMVSDFKDTDYYEFEGEAILFGSLTILTWIT